MLQPGGGCPDPFQVKWNQQSIHLHQDYRPKDSTTHTVKLFIIKFCKLISKAGGHRQALCETKWRDYGSIRRSRDIVRPEFTCRHSHIPRWGGWTQRVTLRRKHQFLAGRSRVLSPSKSTLVGLTRAFILCVKSSPLWPDFLLKTLP